MSFDWRLMAAIFLGNALACLVILLVAMRNRSGLAVRPPDALAGAGAARRGGHRRGRCGHP
jgi:hypothetical protein